MTGALSLRTKMEIPPGDEDVVDKLRLDGRFAIGDGRFTDHEVQLKIGELSRRGSGQLKETPTVPKVDSDFTGRFRLANGVLSLPSVTFDVPGAAVQLAGQYALKRETIDFAGNLYMDAKISQTVSGWKSWLLKVVDPLFRKNGRTVVPIKIAGTRNAPAFGLDAKRVFRNGDGEPGAKATTGNRSEKASGSPKPETAKRDDAKRNDPKRDNAKRDDARREDAKRDDTKKDDAKKDDAKRDSGKQGAAKPDAGKSTTKPGAVKSDAAARSGG
jgi:hypothetical protein